MIIIIITIIITDEYIRQGYLFDDVSYFLCSKLLSLESFHLSLCLPIYSSMLKLSIKQGILSHIDCYSYSYYWSSFFIKPTT